MDDRSIKIQYLGVSNGSASRIRQDLQAFTRKSLRDLFSLFKEKGLENVALRDRYNNLWLLKVEMTGGYFYFKDGWTKFVADNMIEEGNWIAYEYFSHGILDFKVYDHSDCLTQGVGGHISNKPDEQDINIEPDIDVVGHTDDRGDHPERANVMDAARKGDPKGSQEKDKRRPREDSSSNDHPRGGQVRDDSTNSTRKRSKRDHDWYDEELFRSGVIQQPHNAYFVTKKKKNRAGELLVPKEVIRAYDLKLPESVLLIDPQERKFRVKHGRTGEQSMREVGKVSVE